MSRNDVKPAAALAGASVAIFFVGFLQFLTEAAPGIKPFLTLNAGIGPLSGKVFLAYLIGLVVFILAKKMLKDKNVDITKYYHLLIASLVIASLLSLTPFTGILLGA
ncbi:MAG TPA: hypothetical protein VJI12_04135 [archaeon]|nr:hypothetical protein [archaeon]